MLHSSIFVRLFHRQSFALYGNPNYCINTYSYTLSSSVSYAPYVDNWVCGRWLFKETIARSYEPITYTMCYRYIGNNFITNVLSKWQGRHHQLGFCLTTFTELCYKVYRCNYRKHFYKNYLQISPIIAWTMLIEFNCWSATRVKFSGRHSYPQTPSFRILCMQAGVHVLHALFEYAFVIKHHS